MWYEVPFDRMSTKYYYGWRVWSIELPVEYEGWLEFCCRTWDNICQICLVSPSVSWNLPLNLS